MRFLDELHEAFCFTEILCGMAKGADVGGRKWAERRGIAVREFPAQWAKYGKAAGPMRNEEMAKVADMVIAFPGGKGTKDMKWRALNHGAAVIEPAESTDLIPAAN